MPDKGNAWEHLIRVHNLVQFLTERGSSGAKLEDIRETVYGKLEDSEAFHKKFYRDRKALENIYDPNVSGSLSETDDEADEVDVKIYKKNNRYYIKSKFMFTLPMTIKEEELQALVAGVKLAGHFIKPLEASAASLWKKLEKQFPESKMKKGERLSQAISIAMPVSEVDKSGHDVFQKTVQAIDDKKVLKIRQYEERDGKQSRYTISPYALFFKYHAWYLIGISAEKNASSPAVFRLNRMKMPEVLPDGEFIECPYSPEELKKIIELDFDPFNPNKKYLVKLRITGSFAQPAMETEWYGGEKKKKVKAAADGRIEEVLYEVELKGLERITLWIMRALDCIEVLEPKELKDEIDRRVAAYLERGRRAVS